MSKPTIKPFSLRFYAVIGICLYAAIKLTPEAKAQTEPHDAWGDKHCIEHGAGEFAAGVVTSYFIENKPAAVAVALIPGLYRENWKARHGYDSYSPSRLTWDIAGALAGVYTGNWIFTRQQHQTTIAYIAQF